MRDRRIGPGERFSTRECRSSLDDLLALIDWSGIEATLAPVHASDGKGELAAVGDVSGAVAVGLVRSVQCEAGRGA